MTAKRKKTSIIRILFRWLSYLFGFVILLVVIAYSIAALNEQRILDAINKQLATAINGDIKVGGLHFTLFEDFPTFSISLTDIYLRGPRYQRYHKDFFNAEKIYVNIQPLRFIQHQSVKMNLAQNRKLFGRICCQNCKIGFVEFKSIRLSLHRIKIGKLCIFKTDLLQVNAWFEAFTYYCILII